MLLFFENASFIRVKLHFIDFFFKLEITFKKKIFLFNLHLLIDFCVFLFERDQRI